MCSYLYASARDVGEVEHVHNVVLVFVFVLLCEDFADDALDGARDVVHILRLDDRL